MADINWLNVVVRVLHILGAVIAVGGAIFAVFAVLPAVQVIPDESKKHFHEEVRRRFALLVMISITLLLLSGFYNYLVNEVPAHKGQSAYNALMGIKILLAFGVFFLASTLTGKSPAFEKMRKKRKRWMTLNILLALIIISIGAVLRAMPDVVK